MEENKVEVYKLLHESAASLSPSVPIERQDLITSSRSWVGVARTMPGLASAWHHHSDNDTYGYVISGQIRIEFGPGGNDSVQINAGEVFHVPSEIVHREVSVGTQPGTVFLVRVGAGKPVVNVDGPERTAVS